MWIIREEKRRAVQLNPGIGRRGVYFWNCLVALVTIRLPGIDQNTAVRERGCSRIPASPSHVRTHRPGFDTRVENSRSRKARVSRDMPSVDQDPTVRQLFHTGTK